MNHYKLDHNPKVHKTLQPHDFTSILTTILNKTIHSDPTNEEIQTGPAN